MIDIVPDKKVVKINATVDDDINLILDAIVKVDAAYVLLVIPEGNDLITSPIGLKALRKKTLEKGKRMVLVVPTGDSLEITKRAGFMATTSVESVTSDVWQTVSTQYDEYYHAQVGMNSKKKLPHQIESKVEYMNPVKNDIPAPEIISGGSRQVAPPSEESIETPHDKPIVIETPESPKHEPAVERRDVSGLSVTGMDFSRLIRQGKLSTPPKKIPTQGQVTISPAQEVNSFNPDILPKKIGVTIAKLPKKASGGSAGKIAFGVVGIFFLFAAALFFMYYTYFPRLRVNVTIQAESLSLTDTATATSAITGLDVNKKEVQLTREKSIQNGTKTFTPTEPGVEGVKAAGQVSLQNTDPSVKNFPVGTLITAGSLKFALAEAVTIPAASYSGSTLTAVGLEPSVAVTASDLGEEYNVPAGTTFAVSTDAKVTGTAVTAFSGGTKRTFLVVGQKDVDEATKALQKELEDIAISELADKNKDKGYAFIRESIKTEIKDKATITPAVGTEVKTTDQQPTVAFYTTTTALYYHKESVIKLAEKLLLEKYRIAKSLTNDDMATTTIQDLTVEIVKVNVDKNDNVTVDFKASGLATTKIDIEALRNQIVGKKWPEMLEVLSKLPALQKQPEVKFYPDWIPEFLKYVPKEPGRIDVKINVVAPVVSEPTPTATTTP